MVRHRDDAGWVAIEAGLAHRKDIHTSMKTFVLLATATALFSAARAATTHTWTGNGVNGNWSRPENWENFSVPPANSTVNLVFPSSKPWKASVANISGLTISSLTVYDYGMKISGPAGGLTLSFSGTITVHSGSLTFANPLTVRLAAGTSVNLDTSIVGLNTYSDSSIRFETKITGPGSLTIDGDSSYGKENAGMAQFVAYASNDYAGSTTFKDGVQVSLANYALALAPAPLNFLPIGAVSIPGDVTIKTGADVSLLRSNQIANAADVTLLENSRLDLQRYSDTISSFTCKGRFETELAGDSTYGRLTVNGAVSLTSHSEGSWDDFTSDQLKISRDPDYFPGANKTFTIITNDNADAIGGTFYGWPENEAANSGGVVFHLHYSGGTGNDLTFKNP